MSTEDFWVSPTPESTAKIEIVSSHFGAWLKIVGPTAKRGLAYVELFAGAGIYDDGTESTPIRVLRAILASPLATRFTVILNEVDPVTADRLHAAVNALPGIEQINLHLLREEITVDNADSFLERIGAATCYLWHDPWGYVGVTQELIRKFITIGWGRDGLIFFNYPRINAAIFKPDATEHMLAMFGSSRLQKLREKLPTLKMKHERKDLIHAAMDEALREAGAPFVHRFDFEKRGDSIFFITQDEYGLRTVKNSMKKLSDKSVDGVPKYSHRRHDKPETLSLFEPRLIPELAADLLRRFAGLELSFEEIVRLHNPNTPYVDENYRAALQLLEQAEDITVFSRSRRRTGTFGPAVRITFSKT